MPPLVRAELDDRKIELDDVRTRLAGTLGADEQPLTKLRRVTWGSVLNLALLALAAFAIITVLGDIDLESFVDALADASWWWLAFALVLAQLPRIPSAVSTMGAINRPLPLGPLTTKEFAICYVNLAIPSSAARVAINIRFFQRFGVDATTAVSAGVIDSVSGFVVQIFLFLVLFFWSDVDFGITLDTDDLDGLLTIALIAIAVIIVLAVLVCVIPAWRRRALEILAQGPRGHCRAAQPDQGAAAVRREPAQPGALRGRPQRLRQGVRRGVAPVDARAHQHRGDAVRRAAADTGRDGRVRGRADPRPHERRPVERDRLRHRPRLSLRQLLPAADLGLLLLPLAGQAPIPVARGPDTVTR